MLHKFVIATITSLIVAGSLAAAETGPLKDIPELLPLNNWSGTWTAQVENPASRKGESHGEWIVDGRYLQVRWTLAADQDTPASSGTYLMTYDVKQKIYRQWHFNSDGFTGEATGEWDAATKTMTWTARNAPNRTITNKDRFPADGARQFAMTITDQSGNAVFEMSGRHQRQKK